MTLWAALPVAAQPIVQREHDTAVTAQYNVMVAMRDGVRLSTDVYRPSGQGRYPTILMRNPYANGSGALPSASDWVKRGYVFVIQDIRGRYDSEGKFYPYVADAEDGYDTLDWIAAQPWSNGKAGMMGGSYMGSVQWLAASLRPPALAAVIPSVAPFDYHDDAAYPGGAFSLAARVEWAAYMGGRTAQTGPFDLTGMYRHLPLTTVDVDFGMDVPFLRDWLAHPTHDSYWKRTDNRERLSQIEVPALHIGGWFDAFLSGTLRSYSALTERATTNEARSRQKLLIGPWHHRINRAERDPIDFGEQATIDLEEINRRWFDRWLKGEHSAASSESPVRIFVMGENRWRFEQEWPLARTRYTKYYFNSRGRANTAAGDGFLSLKRPTDSASTDTYIYDPDDPVPTLGGGLLPLSLGPGPRDQAPLSGRADVLTFATTPLEEDVEVTGPVTVTLYAASTASDTDFTAKLIDVHPDGKAYNLADGVIRARYRQSLREPRLIEPGKVHEYLIDLVATSNVFRAGHRIRVDISSSNFPRFDRNPNTGHEFGASAERSKATQTVHHTRRFPSHITLPIIPRRSDRSKGSR